MFCPLQGSTTRSVLAGQKGDIKVYKLMIQTLETERGEERGVLVLALKRADVDLSGSKSKIRSA